MWTPALVRVHKSLMSHGFASGVTVYNYVTMSSCDSLISVVFGFRFCFLFIYLVLLVQLRPTEDRK